jgi:diguanylate cyclase (GGDEF)-like protein
LTSDIISVLLIGLDPTLSDELAGQEGFEVAALDTPADAATHPAAHAIVVALEDLGPLETLGALRTAAPDAAVLVVTGPDREADGAVALHAGAEDHLVTGSIPSGLLPRAVKYAVAQRRLHRELSTQDAETGLPNLRGFAPIAEHHLRMADRARSPVVFLFARLDGFAELGRTHGTDEAGDVVRDAAEILLQAVRGSDVPARIAPDTFCVLLTGDARGAEPIVLSRLVESIARHDSSRDRRRELSLSVGSALYDPERPVTLEQIIATASEHLTRAQRGDSSEAP